ncbi:HlyD family type I secretion periplasmic adaptor subunit [Loktanella sp. TSTF-M6]|uniref:Membrane fusion protein (MFP) family protein n=1 Tax=Loktanella gaetbuli TaxID=2881335 RepID=A0ABS8BSU4_9RHOB|nr:HlyD family type I secretion periplasmic adaptor subunit [Loktanella gaetbuli]MCB5198814.1 HlyD family type I secretion periplasmic adaptor subunit [Loktanella gaetbuli]
MTRHVTDRWSARGPVISGGLTLLMLLCGLGGWAVLANISGAVISPGQVEVDRSRQIVQHPDGGIVDRILVGEGQAVQAGDLLIALDHDELAGALAAVDAQILDMRAQQARLVAERDGDSAVQFAHDLRSAGGAAQDVIDGQRRLFAARIDTIRSKTAQLTRQRQQIAAQVLGLDAQQAALTTQRDLIASALADQQSLLNRGLAQASMVMALQREQAELAGRLGQVMAETARAAERMTEIDIQIAGLTMTRREEAITNLRNLRASMLDLAEHRRLLQHRVDRLAIRAPVSGVVYGLRVHAPRSVVQPADPLMYLVPQDRPRIITIRVRVGDVEQLFPGQQATVRFPAFDQRRTPELSAQVTQISADAFEDAQSGIPFFRAEVELNPGEIDRLPPDLILIPGMPVEVFVRTAGRSPLSYLIKPLSDYFARAFRES